MNRILITRIVVWPYLPRMYRRYATSSSRKRQSNNARTARISSSEGLRIFDASRMDMEQRRQHRVCRLHTWVRSFIDHFHGKAKSTGSAPTWSMCPWLKKTRVGVSCHRQSGGFLQRRRLFTMDKQDRTPPRTRTNLMPMPAFDHAETVCR